MHPAHTLVSILRRARTHGLAVLIAAFVLVTLSATIAFFPEARAEGLPDPTVGEALYDAVGLFAFAGNRFYFPHNIVLQLDYFLAPIVAASAVFGAFARILEERVPLLLVRYRNHTVIGGLGRLGMSIARHSHAQRHPFIAIELDERTPQVADAQDLRGGTVVIGDMTSTAVLRQARCEFARNVFFCASSDIANLDAAFHARRIMRVHGHPRPRIFVHVFDAGLSDAFERGLRAKRRDEVEILPFNSYRFVAKALLAMLVRDKLVPSLHVSPELVLQRTSWPEGEDLEAMQGAPDLETGRERLLAAFRLARPREDGDERYAIVGMGRLGRALARNLLDHTSPTSRILVVEKSAEHYRAQLETFPAEQRGRFEAHFADANDLDAGARIEAFKPAAGILCTDNDLGNLRLALDLHGRGIRTVTRMFDLDASPELRDGLSERGIATASLSRLFHAAIPILTHERRLIACVNLDVSGGHAPEELFYLARVTPKERAALGKECLGLDELPHDEDCPAPPDDVALVWHRGVHRLGLHEA